MKENVQSENNVEVLPFPEKLEKDQLSCPVNATPLSLMATETSSKKG
jgi:hypothetical protein